MAQALRATDRRAVTDWHAVRFSAVAAASKGFVQEALSMNGAPPKVPLSIDEPIEEMADDGTSDGALLERFLTYQDHTAFEILVRRHGPMVRAACRGWLHDCHAVEDAYQATFLVLLRKAHLIARPERLAGWLYGVATRIARKARVSAFRRVTCERQAIPEQVAADPFHEVARQDLRSALVAAMHLLPEQYRAALVLCYWEGKTNHEAARQLGCPAGSMSWRLQKGRELLRRQLTGIGATISG
jgi:RNA polymerase sigma factor (sigma-70 family)